LQFNSFKSDIFIRSVYYHNGTSYNLHNSTYFTFKDTVSLNTRHNSYYSSEVIMIFTSSNNYKYVISTDIILSLFILFFAAVFVFCYVMETSIIVLGGEPKNILDLSSGFSSRKVRVGGDNVIVV